MYKAVAILSIKYIEDTSNVLSTNPKRFWSIVKARCMTLDNYTATSAADKASLFNTFFHSNFMQPMSHDEISMQQSVTCFLWDEF